MCYASLDLYSERIVSVMDIKFISSLTCVNLLNVTYLVSLHIVLSLTACGSVSDPLPSGIEGPEAERLADQLLSVIKAESFERAEGAQWTFRSHRYLWHRGLGRVRVSLEDDLHVYLDLKAQRGWSLEAGVRPEPSEESEHVADAIKAFNNDSFWAFAPFKVRDGGTTRAHVRDPETKRSALLIHYRTGGSTPGDHYLWHLDKEGRPERWQMWVSIIPVGGVSSTWSEWRETRSGAWVATEHRFRGGVSLRLEDIEITERFEQLGVSAPKLTGQWPSLSPQ